MSLDESIEKLEYSYAFFQANRLSRYMLTGKKSMGPVGFVADQTVPCLLTNVKSLKTVRETIDRMGDKLKNRKKIMPYAILNESHVEHSFGNNIQTLTVENAEMKDYVYNKPKLHMKSILQTCTVPFHFITNKNKDYAKPMNFEVDAKVIIKMIKASEPSVPLRNIPESKTYAGLKLIKTAINACKGMRPKSNRSYHKPRPYYAPPMIPLRDNEHIKEEFYN